MMHCKQALHARKQLFMLLLLLLLPPHQGEGEEEETDDLIGQVLDEIGISTTTQVRGSSQSPPQTISNMCCKCVTCYVCMRSSGACC
jgi:hypothetical protein